MKKTFKGILSFILVVSLLITSTISVLAVDGEIYLSDLRIIYAEDYNEACDILDESEFYEYEILDENLNEDTGEIGVFLAYKTTEYIEDAITDISIIEMDGGYREGTYQEMLKQSYEEYVSLGENYVIAIDYMMDAYKANSFPAKAAFRQLNFYTVIDDEVSFDGELLGDIFASGITAHEIATIFMEGNMYALNNIRSLISMGVTYNADGKTYLDKVEEEAAKYEADPSIYSIETTEQFDKMAVYATAALYVFNEMLTELKPYESQLNYEDENLTDLELQYAEHKAIADLMREVDYLNGKTLYDFCLEEGSDMDMAKEKVYPMLASLNEGQKAMSLVGHFYDVVRYSMNEFPEDLINSKISEQEKIYSISPFDVYTGVDRDIYDGTFALTSEAYREDAYTEEGLANFLFNQENVVANSLAIAGGAVGVGLAVWAICRTGKTLASVAVQNRALDAATAFLDKYVTNLDNAFGAEAFSVPKWGGSVDGVMSNNELADSLLNTYFPNTDPATLTLSDKIGILEGSSRDMSAMDSFDFTTLKNDYEFAQFSYGNQAAEKINNAHEMTVYGVSKSGIAATGLLYLIGGALMIYSALTLALSIEDYYNPEYTAIPIAMVDLVDTVDGDRYIKYDVVYEVEARGGANYVPADLNAFEGQRWNALYYTKSYEAGNPLLADFELSNSNNMAEDGFTPVHRFGEVICYDLNKYNFDYDTNIYLSVAQSENQKSAVADVPELIGSVFSAGWVLLASGIGALAGVGATLGTQKLCNKRKNKNEVNKEI